MRPPSIIPQYIRGGPCDPSCRWCEPTQGVERAGWRELTPDQLRAGIETYRERGIRGGILAFYGTGLLDIPLAEQAALRQVVSRWRGDTFQAVRIAARPEQIQAALLEPWIEVGLGLVELEIPTLWPTALRWLGPHHRPEAVGSAVTTLRSLGLELAAHTSPGLPGSDAEASEDTAEAVIALGPRHVRITPAVIVRGSHLEQAWRRGIFRPLTVDAAVDLGRRLLDLHEAEGVPVVRYGWQPNDLRLDPDQIVGGPFHPSLRTLVESSRAYEQAVRLLQLRVRPGQAATLRVHPSETTFLRGLQNLNLHRLRRRFRCRLLEVEGDSTLGPGVMALDVDGRRLTLGRGEGFAS